MTDTTDLVNDDIPGEDCFDLEELCENEQADKGKFIASLLGIKARKDGKYDTGWGYKTPLGLYRCILRIVETDSDDLLM